LTVFTDLVFAVEVGMVFAVFLIFIKLTNIINVSPRRLRRAKWDQSPDKLKSKIKDKVSVYTLHGPFFFGAMNLFDRKLTSTSM
jgi:SulP family sulfate permease